MTRLVVDGFVYEIKKLVRLDLSLTFSKKEFLGKIKTTKKQKFINICN
jgi:hypothetical protein